MCIRDRFECLLLQDIIVVTLSSLFAAITAFIVNTSPAKANPSLKPACTFCSPAVQDTKTQPIDSRVEQDDIRSPDLVGVKYHLANVVELVRIPSQQHVSPPLSVYTMNHHTTLVAIKARLLKNILRTCRIVTLTAENGLVRCVC